MKLVANVHGHLMAISWASHGHLMAISSSLFPLFVTVEAATSSVPGFASCNRCLVKTYTQGFHDVDDFMAFLRLAKVSCMFGIARNVAEALQEEVEGDEQLLFRNDSRACSYRVILFMTHQYICSTTVSTCFKQTAWKHDVFEPQCWEPWGPWEPCQIHVLRPSPTSSCLVATMSHYRAWLI